MIVIYETEVTNECSERGSDVRKYIIHAECCSLALSMWYATIVRKLKSEKRVFSAGDTGGVKVMVYEDQRP